MRKNLNIGKMLILSMLIAIATSCDKDIAVTPPPPVVHQPPAAPALEVKADTALYNGTATIAIATLAPGVTLTQNGNVVSSGKMTLSGLKKDTTLTFVAKITNEWGLSATTTKDVSVKVCSPRKTTLVWDSVRNQYAKWLQVSFKVTRTDVINWFDGPLDCNIHTYFPNDIRRVTVMCTPGFVGISGTDGYQLLNGEEEINWGYAYNPPNKWTIESLDQTTMVLSKIQQVQGESYFGKMVLTYKKIQ